MKRSIVLLVASVLVAAAPASANFLEAETGARAMGMGGAFVAVADDVTALHWNPAGLADLEGVQVFGMRTSVYSVDGLTEDSAMAGYGTGCRGFGAGWMRTGATDLYNEDTIVVGYGQRLGILEGLRAGVSVKRFSIEAPGYEYYNDPAYESGGDDGYAGDVGLLYHRGQWTYAATYRNIGEPELQLLDTTEDTDKITGEFRLGASYLFREVMLMTAELRMPNEVPSYYEESTSLNLGTEIWFYEVFALRAGMNRDRITAGLGIKTDHVRLDVALLSERRIGSLYRLSAILAW
jgi:hypothetical protein